MCLVVLSQALAPALRVIIRCGHVGDNPLRTLAVLSEDDLDAAFEASIEFMKQDSHKKLVKVHETSKAYARLLEDFLIKSSAMPGRYKSFKMPSSTLAEFREGLQSRIGASLSL